MEKVVAYPVTYTIDGRKLFFNHKCVITSGGANESGKSLSTYSERIRDNEESAVYFQPMVGSMLRLTSSQRLVRKSNEVCSHY